jgi:hypothetical protein
MFKQLLSIILFFSLFLTGCSLNYKHQSAQNNVDQERVSNIDTQQKFSFDGKQLVFVRDVGDKRPSENFAEGYDLYNQIILKNNGTNEDRVIVNAGKIADLNIKNIDVFPIDVLANLSNPVFSLDDDKVFFNASAWMTSLATFSYDLNTGDLAYLTHGSIKEIVKEGKNSGHLILIQRKHIEDQPVMYCEFVVDENSGDIIEDLDICL